MVESRFRHETTLTTRSDWIRVMDAGSLVGVASQWRQPIPLNRCAFRGLESPRLACFGGCAIPGTDLLVCGVGSLLVFGFDVGENWANSQGSTVNKLTSWSSFWKPTAINAFQAAAVLLPGAASELAEPVGFAEAWQLNTAHVMGGSPALVLGACQDVEEYGCEPSP